MESLFCELKLDVKALFNADLHLDRIVLLGLDTQVLNDELFFLRDSIIVTIDHHIDKVSQPNDNAVVWLKLFFDTIEREIIGHVVCEWTRWLQVTNKL